MALGAGLFVALGAGAAEAGWWLLAGLLLAGLLSLAARLVFPAVAPVPVSTLESAPAVSTSAPSVPAPVDSAPSASDTGRGWLVTALPAGFRLAGTATLLALYGSVFAAHLLPGVVRPAAAGFAVLLIGAVLLGARLSLFAGRVATGLLLAAALLLVALCVAVTPAPALPLSGPGPLGALGATAVCFPLLHRARGTRGLAVALLAGLAVSLAALYQLGPVRPGLSATPLRDLLGAADAGPLLGVLGAAVLLATVAAGLSLFTGTSAERPVLAGCGVAAAGLAALLGPFDLMALAAALALGELLARCAVARPRGAGPLAVGVVAVLLLAFLPPLGLLVAAVLAGLGVLLADGRYRAAND